MLKPKPLLFKKEKHIIGTMKRKFTIELGTTFKVLTKFAGGSDREDVVIGLGEENYFHAARLNSTKDGKKWFFHAGTSDPEYIDNLTGKMSTQEVIEAAREGARQVGLEELSLSMEEDLLLESRKGSRVVTKK